MALTAADKAIISNAIQRYGQTQMVGPNPNIFWLVDLFLMTKLQQKAALQATLVTMRAELVAQLASLATKLTLDQAAVTQQIADLDDANGQL